ncbi:MAG: metalloprotease TldD [Hyphomicrobiales bacterium]|nr:metalloprotease TldD [Hyphomicrobiales bacterium]
MTNSLTTLHTLFFDHTGLDHNRVQGIIGDALGGMDDGELFLEYSQSESLVFDDNCLKSATFDTSRGFGLRSVLGEGTAYAHSTDLSEASLKRAADVVQAVRAGHNGSANVIPAPAAVTVHHYPDINPLQEVDFTQKTRLLQEIDAYLRAKDSRVRQVSVSLSGEWQAVLIQREDGQEVGDIRPLVRLNISVVVEENGNMERGSYGMGGRQPYGPFIAEAQWKKAADEALRQALVNVSAKPAPAGEMTVVVGPGWPGVLLHEAVGHGLEGDFNRKGTSVFSGRIGERVAAPGVTVVDDGTLPDRRGSLSVDDEGTPAGRTVLIENGILKGYMQDRLNARLMGVSPTGNGRRESFEHQPMPRMTNTCMLSGDRDPEDILKSVRHGLYAVNFGGGQVDITSGRFVFSASEAYMIEDGKIGAPVKGATLIGNGPDVMQKITAVGNDMQLDPGIGTCGKDAQSVPVGVAQPTLRIQGMTVGGTEV